MKTSETLNLILADLKALRGQPLNWENLQWFKFHIEAIREVATPSPLKDEVLRKLSWRYQDLKKIYIRRWDAEYDELVRLAGDLRLIPIMEWDEVQFDEVVTGYSLTRI